MNFDEPKKNRTHGSGVFKTSKFKAFGKDNVLEAGVMVFHPENITVGNNVYVGHNSYIKAYHMNELKIGDHSWIGQSCFLHSAGGLTIGKAVGIGPFVKILTSEHDDDGDLDRPIIFKNLKFAPVELKDGCDIGFGAIILPGVTVGQGAIVGAGSVVTKDIPDFEVWAGVPAKFLKKR